jgi:four helix bundle protein
MDAELVFEEWMKSVPARIRSDPLWDSAYYRFALYLYDLAWLDCEILYKDYRGREIVGQLIRSVGSISANVEEAYGRGVGTADYIRVLRIALGEGRETQGWYFRARHLVPADLMEKRIDLIQQIIALLVTTISRHRQKLAHT